MTQPAGRRVPLSLSRRLVADLLHFAREVPLVTADRRMNLAPLVAARQSLTARPGWCAIFTKAFAVVAAGPVAVAIAAAGVVAGAEGFRTPARSLPGHVCRHLDGRPRRRHAAPAHAVGARPPLQPLRRRGEPGCPADF